MWFESPLLLLFHGDQEESRSTLWTSAPGDSRSRAKEIHNSQTNQAILRESFRSLKPNPNHYRHHFHH